MKRLSGVCVMILGLLYIQACWSIQVLRAAEQPVESRPIKAHKTGLLLGRFDPAEPPAKTPAEAALSLKPMKGISTDRPFWLLAPASYDPIHPPPLLIVLHHRGLLRHFSTRTVWSEDHLREYAVDVLRVWRPLAEREGFLLAVPLGDPDVLHMGMTWQCGLRSRVFESLIKTIAKTHPVDRQRIFGVASGEGAHALLVTALQNDELFSAVAVANPPLFEGESGQFAKNGELRGNILPLTVPEILADTKEKPPEVLILAADADEKVALRWHSVTSLPAVRRYEDTSRISPKHTQAMADLLRQGDITVQCRTYAGSRQGAFPVEEIPSVWRWLKERPRAVANEATR